MASLSYQSLQPQPRKQRPLHRHRPLVAIKGRRGVEVIVDADAAERPAEEPQPLVIPTSLCLRKGGAVCPFNMLNDSNI